MFKAIQSWKGKVSVDGVEYASVGAVPADIPLKSDTVITLIPPTMVQHATQKVVKRGEPVLHIITVREYMTKPSSPTFDFMEKWNKNNPMPLRTMVGTVLEETRGMVKMKLHAELTAERTYRCLCCGRELKNPVSQFFGMGPECGGHDYSHPFDTDEELRAAVEHYKQTYLAHITWEGWIIKSAIIEDIIKEE